MSESMVTRVAIAVSNVIREENGLPAKPAPLEGTRAEAIARAAIAEVKKIQAEEGRKFKFGITSDRK